VREVAEESTAEKLKGIRNKLATIYKDLAVDQIPDDGNLTDLNSIILLLQRVIKKLEA
jgi:hypothetical protein